MASITITNDTASAGVSQSGPVTIYPADTAVFGDATIVIEVADTDTDAEYRYAGMAFRSLRTEPKVLDATGDYFWRAKANINDPSLNAKLLYH